MYQEVGVWNLIGMKMVRKGMGEEKGVEIIF